MKYTLLVCLSVQLLVCGAGVAAAAPSTAAAHQPVVTNKKASRYAAGAMPQSARW
ncbi:MAG: hypothetical protein JSR15_13350, partial [Proteobacteria bacterium]|nr:hypothetical protein [Pseudomonadota bacterium]